MQEVLQCLCLVRLAAPSALANSQRVPGTLQTLCLLARELPGPEHRGGSGAGRLMNRGRRSARFLRDRPGERDAAPLGLQAEHLDLDHVADLEDKPAW